MALGCAACAHGGGPPPEDATRDAEFQAALRRARPDFPRQRDALAAGLYEPFVPPESLAAGPPGAGLAAAPAGPPPPSGERAAAGPAAPGPGGEIPPGEDPSTEELLRALPGASSARAGKPAASPVPFTAAAPRAAGGAYTLQAGAFADELAAARRAAEVRALAPELPVEVARRDDWFKVFLGRFATRGEAEEALGELGARGLGSAWVARSGP